MILDIQITQIFALVLTLLTAGGLSVLLFGKRVPQYCIWVIGLLLLLLLIIIGWSWFNLAQFGSEPETWIRGWILPHDEPNAITVGIVLDAKALIISTIATLVAAMVLLNRPVLNREDKTGKILAALALSTAGVVLAWVSITPWLAFCGILLTISGGFVAQGSYWYLKEGSESATRFAWEKFFGWGLSWLGACVLAGINTPLIWVGTPNASGDWIGSSLLVLGLFMQLQAFPFMGWLLRSCESPPLLRVLLNQILPAWAALAIAVRMEPQLRTLGVFPLIGWITLASALLTTTVGLFASAGRQSLGLWIAAGFSFGLSVIAIAGVQPGTAVFMAVGLGALAIAGATSAFDFRGNRNQSNLRKMTWSKAAVVAGVLLGTGFLGSLGAGGIIESVAHIWENSVALVFIGAAYLFLVLHAWKICWIALKIKGPTDTNWYVILAPFLFVFLGLGVFWSGSITGGVIPGDSDRVMAGLFSAMAGNGTQSFGPDATQVLVYGALWFFGFILAFWMGGREIDVWANLRLAFPRFSKFLLSGYRLEWLGFHLLSGTQWLGRSTEQALHYVAIDGPFFKRAAALFRAGAKFFVSLDERGGEYVQVTLRKAVDLPARGLQYLQNGDVQWYLLMALLSTLAIVGYFLKM
ncbi:MAG: hypothetical protein A2070_06095 [Bdellovibrionales bacterium GWC1_52_8]|nr:MAG: hypothetical protein A2X97_07335 [Bdellovibrionales bacterium GWA1_52_35]OFZ40554.1 MAG: hypothetical protein A2070_06095 [Bdellovibrionales bacterium GWC1_52_8]HCM40691.1 hypothetical protein [Bdellovibrionales bacterium]